MTWSACLRALLSGVLAMLVVPSGCMFSNGSDLEQLDNGKCEADYKACVDPTDGVEKCVPHSDPSYSCAQPTCGPCSLRNARARCLNGACVWAACNTGYKSCDDNDRDGCETDIYFDETNCGDCNRICSVANGSPACIDGICKVSRCNPNFFDCNGRGDDGCECSVPCKGTVCGDAI